jgi:hypothetical protein
MATGPLQFAADNNAGSKESTEIILRSQNDEKNTLVVKNETAAGSELAGPALYVEGGPIGVEAWVGWTHSSMQWQYAALWVRLVRALRSMV